MSETDACRMDVWLWRARFFKTRTLAARFVEAGRLRLARPGAEAARIDKPGRTVKPGDRLIFVLGERLVDIRVEAAGARRGPAEEARGLYSAPPHT